MKRKTEKLWEVEPVELLSSKHLAIIGYGNIGQQLAKIAKLGFGMKVTGIKKSPDNLN